MKNTMTILMLIFISTAFVLGAFYGRLSVRSERVTVWTRWSHSVLVKPNEPWNNWMFVQWRTNVDNGEVQARVVMEGK